MGDLGGTSDTSAKRARQSFEHSFSKVDSQALRPLTIPKPQPTRPPLRLQPRAKSLPLLAA